jgi:zinc transport system substrate-binding protein
MKTTYLSVIVLLTLTALASLYAQPVGIATETPKVVVTTTLIESAMRDLMGQNIEVVRLLPPGSCPGHFDLEPGQVAAMASARLFIRHDYQAGLDEGFAKSGLNTGRVVSLTSLPAFTIPSNYVAMCTELTVRLVHEWPEKENLIRQGLQAIQSKAVDTERDSRLRTKRIRARKVLCARYQKDFCQWIGLNVVAVFNAGTDESAWQLNRAVDMAKTAGAEAVIGNLQWGPQHLEALSEATGLPGIMLSNFPERGSEGAYWALVSKNVNALLEGFHDAGH